MERTIHWLKHPNGRMTESTHQIYHKQRKNQMKNTELKNQAVVRTSTVRMLLTPEQRVELDTLNCNHQLVASAIQQTIYGFSGRVLDHKMGGAVLDGSTATKEQTDIYNLILNWKGQSTGLTNPLLAERFPFSKGKDVISELREKQTEYNELNRVNVSKLPPQKAAEHRKELTRAENNLKYSADIVRLVQQRATGTLPISLSPECRSHLENNYKQDVVKGWKGRFDSWKKCDAAAQTNYHENEEKLIALSSELSKTYGPNVVAELNDLLVAVKTLGERYTDVSYLNYKFLLFFNGCWRPHAVATGEGLLAGHRMAKDRRSGTPTKVAYSFSPKVNAELLKRKLLWAPEKCILSDPEFEKYVELYDAHLRYRKQASLTLISEESPIPIGFSLDGNAAKLVHIENDKTDRLLNITIKLPNGEERTYTSTYARRKDEKKCYYNDLEVRLPRGEKELKALAKVEKRKMTDKETLEASLVNCYVFEYARQGKIPVFATVKTLYIRRNPTNEKYYFVLPVNIYTEHHSNTGLDSKELFRVRSLLQTSWKELRNPNRNEQTCRLDKEISTLLDGRTLKYAGVDLGYNNPYSVTYYDVIGKKDGIQWNETGTEMVSVIRNEQYDNLKWDMRRLMDVIRATRQYLQGGAEIKTSDADVKNFNVLMALLPVEQRITHTQYITQLEAYKQDGKLVKDLKRVWEDKKVNGQWVKRTDVWIICTLMYVITQTMNQIRGNRDANGKLTGNKDWLSIPCLIELIDTYYNLKKTFNDSGDGIKVLPKDHVYAEGEKRRLTVREEDLCGGILNWRDNLKDYFIKKLFSQLAHRCHELGIGIVTMEDLEMLGSYKNKKEQNRMFNMWPRGQMKKFAEDAFGYMGILIQYVDENGTSQHDADTGIRGCRDRDNLWMPDGTRRHADKNASKMIALRGLTHHTNIYKRKLTKVGNGYYVNSYEFAKLTKDKTSLPGRVRGAETNLCGYSATVYQTSGNGVAVVPNLNATTIIDGKDIPITKENTESYYKMDKTNTWYPWNVVKQYEDDTKKKIHLSI